VSKLSNTGAMQVFSFATAHDFQRNLQALDPDCVMVDLHLTDKSGLRVQQDLLAQHNEVSLIFICQDADVTTAVQAMRNGALNFLTGETRPHTLLDAVQEAISHDGQRRDRDEMVRRAQALYDRLTPREKQTFHLMADGCTTREIAEKLEVEPVTANAHQAKVLEKVGARSAVDVVHIEQAMYGRNTRLKGKL
jgi:FixJ family two-component response regulator